MTEIQKARGYVYVSPRAKKAIRSATKVADRRNALRLIESELTGEDPRRIRVPRYSVRDLY